MKETLLTIHKKEKAMKLIDKIEAMTKLISKIGEKVVKITGKCSNGKFSGLTG